MPRFKRLVVPDYPHHVIIRGNRRQTVFHDDEARTVFLNLLSGPARALGIDVLAYCLMDNHVHLIVVPRREHSLASAMLELASGLARHVNRKRGWTGTLWQGRYSSCVLDESHLLAALRYVERNPVRAGIVSRAEEYAWSSASARVFRTPDPCLSAGGIVPTVQDWATFLATPWPCDDSALRRDTQRARPTGNPGFIDRLEALTGRRLHILKPGPRPRGADRELRTKNTAP